MSWNHRVLKSKDGGDDWYQIHEVYYKDEGIEGFTENGVTIGAHSVEVLRWVLNKMIESLDQDVIDSEMFD